MTFDEWWVWQRYVPQNDINCYSAVKNAWLAAAAQERAACEAICEKYDLRSVTGDVAGALLEIRERSNAGVEVGKKDGCGACETCHRGSPNADEANEEKYNRLDKEFNEAWDRGDYDT